MPRPGAPAPANPAHGYTDEEILAHAPYGWTLCPLCHYEKAVGLPCGLPCV